MSSNIQATDRETFSRRAYSWPGSLAIVLSVIVLLAAGCATQPPARVQDRTGNELATNNPDRLYTLGRYGDAEQIYLRRAEEEPARQDLWLLRAADAAYMDENLAAARRHLAQVNTNQLDRSQALLARLLRHVISRFEPEPNTVIRDLVGPAAALPTEYRTIFLTTRSRAYTQLRQFVPAAQDRIALDDLLVDRTIKEENQNEILNLLMRLRQDDLDRLSLEAAHDLELAGWLSLASALKTSGFSGQSAQQALTQWRDEHPNHPALIDAGNFVSNRQEMFTIPEQIALLLPLSGRFPQAAEAIRDGFLTAYFADELRQEAVKIYDTGDDIDRVLSQYNNAVQAGATHIVGPLTREATTALLLQADGSIPIIALNFADMDAPPSPNSVQFGLDAGQEAQEIAQFMIQDGRRNALVLSPESAWGRRVVEQFAKSFEAYGGNVTEWFTYDEREQDYSALIKQVVGLNDATQRARRVQGDLGTPLVFEPQRRRDIDALFMAARPGVARRIKPQLAFHNAGDLPIYATSHVYEAKAQPDADRDLNGVKFCDAPWVLQVPGQPPSLRTASSEFSGIEGVGARLFAIGLDAYRVLPYLNWLQMRPTEGYPGSSGTLQLKADGTLHRQLACGMFRGGLARSIQTPAEIQVRDQ